jgi:hypothetical protein
MAQVVVHLLPSKLGDLSSTLVLNKEKKREIKKKRSLFGLSIFCDLVEWLKW